MRGWGAFAGMSGWIRVPMARLGERGLREEGKSVYGRQGCFKKHVHEGRCNRAGIDGSHLCYLRLCRLNWSLRRAQLSGITYAKVNAKIFPASAQLPRPNGPAVSTSERVSKIEKDAGFMSRAPIHQNTRRRNEQLQIKKNVLERVSSSWSIFPRYNIRRKLGAAGFSSVQSAQLCKL